MLEYFREIQWYTGILHLFSHSSSLLSWETIIRAQQTLFVALMGTESVSLVEKNQEENQPVSPGFSSFPTFILRRAEVLDNPLGPVGAENASDLEISSVPTSSEIDGYASIKRSLKCKQRPWIVYDQLQSEREPDVKQHDMVILVSSLYFSVSKCKIF